MDKYQMVKFVDDDFTLDVRADKENETVWLMQEEMSTLFDLDRTRIACHIANIYKEGELDKKAHVRKTHKFKLKVIEKLKERLSYTTWI